PWWHRGPPWCGPRSPGGLHHGGVGRDGTADVAGGWQQAGSRGARAARSAEAGELEPGPAAERGGREDPVRGAALEVSGIEHQECGGVAGVAGDLLAPSPHDDLRVRAQHLDRAADPVEGHAVAPALEADEAVEAHAPAHDHVEGRLHVPERLQVKPLDPEGFLDRGARGRALEPAKQRGRPLVQRRLELSELRPVLREEVTEVVAENAYAPLGLALVLPPAHAAGVDAEAQLAGKDFVGAVEDRRGPTTPGDAGLEVIDPDPERHPAVATEELQVPRVPRQLVSARAHPRKAGPAVRQHAHEAEERLLDTADPAPHLEPVVLRLHSGRRLHAPQRPHRRRPVAAPDMPHHALVAPRKAILAGEDLVDLPRLGRPALTRQPHVLQSLEHAVDRFLVAIGRGPLPAPPVRPLALRKSPQPVAERALPHPELLRHVADRDTAL